MINIANYTREELLEFILELSIKKRHYDITLQEMLEAIAKGSQYKLTIKNERFSVTAKFDEI